MAIIVTIARQHGSGGRQIGQEVARLLNANYVDRQLISLAAQRAGVDEERLAEWDERPTSRSERIVRQVARSLARSSTAVGYSDYSFVGGYVELPPEDQEIDEQRYLSLMKAVMVELAQAGSIVIIGRGANMILKDIPNVLRVLVVAPLERRVRRVVERDGLGPAAARREVLHLDHSRSHFVSQLFGVRWDDPMNYDLVVNTGRYSTDLAGRLIADVARELEGHISP